MGFDETKFLKPERQFAENACRAASTNRRTAAQIYGRKTVPRSELVTKFDHLMAEDGSMPITEIRTVCESAEAGAELKAIGSETLKKDYTRIDSPMNIIFNYPKIGETHMNVIFDQKDDTVVCMEPDHSFPEKDGRRTGTDVRRSLNFFANSEQIGIGYLPLADAFKQTQ